MTYGERQDIKELVIYARGEIEELNYLLEFTTRSDHSTEMIEDGSLTSSIVSRWNLVQEHMSRLITRMKYFEIQEQNDD